jgi:hypothetical protein
MPGNRNGLLDPTPPKRRDSLLGAKPAKRSNSAGREGGPGQAGGKADNPTYGGAALDTSKPQDWDQFVRPISVTKLMLLFRQDRQTIKRRLADLDPVGTHRGQDPLYDFLQAAQRLVEPKFDAKSLIRKMRPQDLPAELQQTFWAAQKSRQAYMVQAGELWHTTDVMRTMSEAFQVIKTTTQLWQGQLEAEFEVQPQLRDRLLAMSDGLLDMVHEALVEIPNNSETRASDEELEHVGDIAEMLDNG